MTVPSPIRLKEGCAASATRLQAGIDVALATAGSNLVSSIRLAGGSEFMNLAASADLKVATADGRELSFWIYSLDSLAQLLQSRDRRAGYWETIEDSVTFVDPWAIVMTIDGGTIVRAVRRYVDMEGERRQPSPPPW